jgi:membrane protein YdbS with pleckstrin-like domain
MTQLMYRCPHCQSRAEVTLDKVGQVNECPACGRPFQPEVPIGRMMLQRADGEWAVGGTMTTATGQPGLGEKKIITVHPAMFRANPLRYMAMVLVFIIGVAGVFIFGVPMQSSWLESLWRPLTIVLSIVFAVLAAASLISMMYWLFRTRFESLAITSERTIWARGILDRETSEVQHDDVRNIQMKQTVVDRILGVGRIAISSAGQDDMEIDIRGVPNPSQVADTVRACQARMSGRDD